MTESTKVRADARRNRERLLDASLRVFSSDRPATLEAVAREAGVGIGTLYRHFPTREALVEATYRAELARLNDAVEELLAAYPAGIALRHWMDGFAEYVRAKRGMAETLRAIAATGAISSAETHTRLTRSISTLLAAGVDDGTLRGGVRADDVFASLMGVVLAAGTPEQAERMLDLLMAALRD